MREPTLNVAWPLLNEVRGPERVCNFHGYRSMNIWELHPAFVHFPLAFLFSSTVLEFVACRPGKQGLTRVAVGLLAAGVIAAPIVALAGLVAYFTVPVPSDEAHLRIVVHGILAVLATAAYALVLALRWKRRAERAGGGALALSAFGALLLGATGAVGGYLVYQDGVGMEPTLPRAPAGRLESHTD